EGAGDAGDHPGAAVLHDPGQGTVVAGEDLLPVGDHGDVLREAGRGGAGELDAAHPGQREDACEGLRRHVDPGALGEEVGVGLGARHVVGERSEEVHHGVVVGGQVVGVEQGETADAGGDGGPREAQYLAAARVADVGDRPLGAEHAGGDGEQLEALAVVQGGELAGGAGHERGVHVRGDRLKGGGEAVAVDLPGAVEGDGDGADDLRCHGVEGSYRGLVTRSSGTEAWTTPRRCQV